MSPFTLNIRYAKQPPTQNSISQTTNASKPTVKNRSLEENEQTMPITKNAPEKKKCKNARCKCNNKQKTMMMHVYQ